MAVAEASSVASRGRGVVAFAGLDANRSVVWLRGEHDLSTLATVAETLARAIAVDDADFVIDLSEVEFIDASTVRLILRTRDFLQSRARSLVLRSPSPPADAMLGRCGLAHLVDRGPAGLRPVAGRAGRPTPAAPGAVLPVRILPSAAVRHVASVLLTHPVDDSTGVVDRRGA